MGSGGSVTDTPHLGKQMFLVVDEANFEEHVLRAAGMVLLNFWASWSDECGAMSWLMHSVADLLGEQDAIVQVDWDRQKKLAQRLGVIGVPTLSIYVRGRELARYPGTMNKDHLRNRIIGARNRAVCSMVE